MVRKTNMGAEWAVLAVLPSVLVSGGARETAAYGLSVLFIFVLSEAFLRLLKQWLLPPFQLPFLLVIGGTLLEIFHIKSGLVVIGRMNFLPMLSLFLLYFSASEPRKRRESAAYFLVAIAALILTQSASVLLRADFHIVSLLALAVFLATMRRLMYSGRRGRRW